MKSQAASGRAAPLRDAPVLMRLRDGGIFDNSAMMDASRLVACQGRWAQLEFNEASLPADVREKLQVTPAARQGLSAGRFRVWVDKICDLQETTCSGLGGDEP